MTAMLTAPEASGPYGPTGLAAVTRPGPGPRDARPTTNHGRAGLPGVGDPAGLGARADGLVRRRRCRRRLDPVSVGTRRTRRRGGDHAGPGPGATTPTLPILPLRDDRHARELTRGAARRSACSRQRPGPGLAEAAGPRDPRRSGNSQSSAGRRRPYARWRVRGLPRSCPPPRGVLPCLRRSPVPARPGSPRSCGRLRVGLPCAIALVLVAGCGSPARPGSAARPGGADRPTKSASRPPATARPTGRSRTLIAYQGAATDPSMAPTQRTIAGLRRACRPTRPAARRGSSSASPCCSESAKRRTRRSIRRPRLAFRKASALAGRSPAARGAGDARARPARVRPGARDRAAGARDGARAVDRHGRRRRRARRARSLRRCGHGRAGDDRRAARPGLVCPRVVRARAVRRPSGCARGHGAGRPGWRRRVGEQRLRPRPGGQPCWSSRAGATTRTRRMPGPCSSSRTSRPRSLRKDAPRLRVATCRPPSRCSTTPRRSCRCPSTSSPLGDAQQASGDAAAAEDSYALARAETALSRRTGSSSTWSSPSSRRTTATPRPRSGWPARRMPSGPRSRPPMRWPGRCTERAALRRRVSTPAEAPGCTHPTRSPVPRRGDRRGRQRPEGRSSRPPGGAGARRRLLGDGGGGRAPSWPGSRTEPGVSPGGGVAREPSIAVDPAPGSLRRPEDTRDRPRRSDPDDAPGRPIPASARPQEGYSCRSSREHAQSPVRC